MKLMILGHGRHGKDTVAEIIQREMGLKFCSSSWFVAEKIMFPAMRLQYKYADVTDCFNDRVNHREEWYQLIKRYNSPDKTRLTREIFSDYDIYVGMRDNVEFLSSREIPDAIIWVDASKRLSLEQSMHITYDPNCMHLIDNNSDEERLYNNVVKTMYEIVEG